MKIALSVLAFLTLFYACPAANAQEPSVHGLWVWKTPIILDLPSRGEALRDFCRSNHINEVYLSYTTQNGGSAEQQEIAKLIGLLHHDHIRVEALLSSADADEPGKHRDKLMAHVNEVLSYNEAHRREKFDGVHLDIEPWQRQENKGSGNLAFLPALLDTYRAVRTLAEQNQMTVNADIPTKLLKGDSSQRRQLMSSLPRFTLMLYELSSPSDGKSTAEQAAKLRQAGSNFMEMAYQGLGGANLARLAIGLRYPDYQQQLPAMLKTVQDAFSGNPHYLGWAWHSYNDVMPSN
ncbi:MAG TPA: hypothetical protein VMB49_01205 [Acidobacteriaceae bacterium]|nr:hypothetical protein [Acidobacteriaceae bacterium]